MADALGSQKLAVSRDCLPCGVGEPMAMATSPWLAIGGVQGGDVSAADTYEPQSVASKPTRCPPDMNDLIPDFQLSSIPLDACRSGNLAAFTSPGQPTWFRRSKIAIPLQKADLEASCLLDCSPSKSPVPGQNRNPLEIHRAI